MSAADAIHRLAGWLADIGADVRPSASPTSLGFRHGSALVLAAAFGGDGQPVLLRFSARVVRGVAAATKPELLRYLLGENDTFLFCAFAVDAEGDIWLHMTLFAERLDRDSFLFALSELNATADAADDQVVRRWGGERFVDL